MKATLRRSLRPNYSLKESYAPSIHEYAENSGKGLSHQYRRITCAMLRYSFDSSPGQGRHVDPCLHLILDIFCILATIKPT